MPKVTLVWVSRPDRPFRIISIPKGLVFTVLGGFVFFLAISMAMFAVSRGYFRENRQERETNLRLQQSLAERESSFRLQHEEREKQAKEQTELLTEKDESIKSLEGQVNALMQQMQSIKESETKIRRFLGIEDRSQNARHPSQGGIGGGQADPMDYADSDIGARESLMVRSHFQIYARSLRSSLQELLDHLERKQAEASRLPTLLPVRGKDLWMSCGFGWRSNPFTGRGKELHQGVDIAGPWRSPITAPADGEVIETGEDRFLGRFIRLSHGKRLTTVYGHLNTVEVTQGKQVKRDEVIGYMGNSGRSTGIHLHYSVLKDGRHVDPLDYIWDRVVPNLSPNDASNESF